MIMCWKNKTKYDLELKEAFQNIQKLSAVRGLSRANHVERKKESMVGSGLQEMLRFCKPLSFQEGSTICGFAEAFELKM